MRRRISLRGRVRRSVGPSVGPSVHRYFQTRTRRILFRVSGLVLFSFYFCFCSCLSAMLVVLSLLLWFQHSHMMLQRHPFEEIGRCNTLYLPSSSSPTRRVAVCPWLPCPCSSHLPWSLRFTTWRRKAWRRRNSSTTSVSRARRGSSDSTPFFDQKTKMAPSSQQDTDRTCTKTGEKCEPFLRGDGWHSFAFMVEMTVFSVVSAPCN